MKKPTSGGLFCERSAELQRTTGRTTAMFRRPIDGGLHAASKSMILGASTLSPTHWILALVLLAGCAHQQLNDHVRIEGSCQSLACENCPFVIYSNRGIESGQCYARTDAEFCYGELCCTVNLRGRGHVAACDVGGVSVFSELSCESLESRDVLSVRWQEYDLVFSCPGEPEDENAPLVGPEAMGPIL